MQSRTRHQCRSRATSTSSANYAKQPRRFLKRVKLEDHENTHEVPLTTNLPSTGAQVPKNLKLGLPTREQYTRIEQDYLNSLSIRKREKALLTQVMFDDVWDVLHNPRDSKLRTPQFRFWVRKMFTLSYEDGDCSTDEDRQPVILHENRPVALKEQIYDIVSYCHRISGHGGRDRTMALVRERYSWIPKELIAQYVKNCPTCVFKKTKDSTLALSLRGPLNSEESLDTDISIRATSTHSMRTSKSASLPLSTSNHSHHEGISAPQYTSNFGPRSAARSSMCETLCLPPLVPRTASMSSASASGSGYGVHSPIEPYYSPTQSSTSWLASLPSMPGPNAPMHTRAITNTLPPIHPPMRRAGSENDADPFRAPATRITLPPLMKALSEGVDVDPLLVSRSSHRHAEGFRIPSFEGAGMREYTWGNPEPMGLNDTYMPTDADIDPVLLHEQYQYEKYASMAPMDGTYPFGLPMSMGTQLVEGYTSEGMPFSGSRSVVMATPVELPHRTLIRMSSGSFASVLDATVPICISSLQPHAADMPSIPMDQEMQHKATPAVLRSTSDSSSSLKSRGKDSNGSFDAQDWEVRYCLDSSPP